MTDHIPDAKKKVDHIADVSKKVNPRPDGYCVEFQHPDGNFWDLSLMADTEEGVKLLMGSLIEDRSFIIKSVYLSTKPLLSESSRVEIHNILVEQYDYLASQGENVSHLERLMKELEAV